MGQIYKGDQLIIDSGGGGTPITVDSALSTTSENPVQNKVITEALNEGLVLHSATEPATPEDGMLWYDETNKVLKIYSEDDAEWKELGEGGVTSINGNTGDITMSTGKITLTQNGENPQHFFLDQTIDKTIDLKGVDKSWKTKTVENGEVEIGIRTLCTPTSDFTLTKPAELIDGEEYVIRFINGSTAFNMTLGHGFTNPFGVDLSLSADAKDQFTFLAIGGILELQPAPVLVAPVENPQAPTGLEATVDGTTGTIKWTDPLDAGTNIWLNTKLVRKAGSEPTSLSDGTVVVTVTTRNQYQSTGYDDTGLTAGTTYYYRAFAEFDEGEILGSASVNVTPELPNSLCFTAQQANSTVQLTQNGTPTPVNLETSTDLVTWTDYTIGDTITLANVGDKVYMRNKSETDTGFSNDTGNYQFAMTGKIGASGDTTSLLNKNGTTTLSDGCFGSLFSNCTSLTTAPELPATTLAENCYNVMFYGCTSLTTLPELPATTLADECYYYMFVGCTGIKLSETQTGEYQIPYRIPTTGTGLYVSGALTEMFLDTGGTFTGTPTINTTYYLSNGVTPPTPGAYTYSQIIDDAYATNGWSHIMSAELNQYPESYFTSLQASGNLNHTGAVYFISHDPTSITGDDVISGYEIYYNPSTSQWTTQQRDMTYNQIVAQATAQGTLSGLLPTFNASASTYYTNLTNSGNIVEVQDPGSKFYMCADGTASTITEIGGQKIFYSPELGEWQIEANYGYWTYEEIIAKSTAEGSFYWSMMEMNRAANGYLISLTNAGHIYQVGTDNYWLSADGTTRYILNGTILRYEANYDKWMIGSA